MVTESQTTKDQTASRCLTHSFTAICLVGIPLSYLTNRETDWNIPVLLATILLVYVFQLFFAFSKAKLNIIVAMMLSVVLYAIPSLAVVVYAISPLGITLHILLWYIIISQLVFLLYLLLINNWSIYGFLQDHGG